MKQETKNCRVLAVVNQKGGVGKTTTAVNLAVCLRKKGKKVLLIDGDPQGNASMAIGIENPDELSIGLAYLFREMAETDKLSAPREHIISCQDIDVIPSNIELSAVEVSIAGNMCREMILQSITQYYAPDYDCIIIDALPHFGLLMINILAAADSIIIPVQADDFYSAKGMEALLSTIAGVRRKLNPRLKVDGVLITKLDRRTSYSSVIINSIREAYGDTVKIYETRIPTYAKTSVMAQEGLAAANYDDKCKLAQSYALLAEEIEENNFENKYEKEC